VRWAPGFPCALCFLGERTLDSSGTPCRENAESRLNVIACNKREAFVQGSKATKQSILSLRGSMDCFAYARNDEWNGLFDN
jgi:hypothetical protein